MLLFILVFNFWLFLFCHPFVFLSPLSQLSVLLAVSSFCFCYSGGCLFSNTSQPAYLLGLYFCCVVFPTPTCTLPSIPLISRHSQLWISGCMWQWYACGLQLFCRNLDCLWCVCVCVCVCGTKPGCPYGWLWEACMCCVRACNSVWVSDCVMALCMTISNDTAIPPCELWLFIGEIIPVQKQDSVFVNVRCGLSSSLLCLVNHVSFCCADVTAELYWIVHAVPGLS